MFIRSKAGFSLIEFIIVVAISATLASIAFMGASSLRNRNDFTLAIDDVREQVMTVKNEAFTTVNANVPARRNDQARAVRPYLATVCNTSWWGWAWIPNCNGAQTVESHCSDPTWRGWTYDYSGSTAYDYSVYCLAPATPTPTPPLTPTPTPSPTPAVPSGADIDHIVLGKMMTFTQNSPTIEISNIRLKISTGVVDLMYNRTISLKGGIKYTGPTKQLTFIRTQDDGTDIIAVSPNGGWSPAPTYLNLSTQAVGTVSLPFKNEDNLIANVTVDPVLQSVGRVFN